MLSKIWHLAYVKKLPAGITQNKRNNIHEFLWNYRKVRVHINTITLPIEMGGLAIMDNETQCEDTRYSFLVCFIKEKIKTKYGLISCRDIWVNTEKENQELASLRHTYVTWIEPLFCRPIELSLFIDQASQVVIYLRQKPLQKYTTSLHFLTLNPTV